MEQESILALIQELRELKTVSIMPEVSSFDDYIQNKKIDSLLFSSKIFKDDSQGIQIIDELKTLHKDLKGIKLIH